MTAWEALWLIKATLQKNEQNLEAIRVLEDVVKSAYRIHIENDDELDARYGTQAQHIRNHMRKVYRKDLEELQKVKEGI